jgi:hypothetical protein
MTLQASCRRPEFCRHRNNKKIGMELKSGSMERDCERARGEWLQGAKKPFTVADVAMFFNPLIYVSVSERLSRRYLGTSVRQAIIRLVRVRPDSFIFAIATSRLMGTFLDSPVHRLVRFAHVLPDDLFLI